MENNSQSAIQSQFLISASVIWIHPQVTTRSANWRLFKQFQRFLLCFHVVIDICMKRNPTFDNWKIVARVLSFKMVWIGAHSYPLKRPNAQKTAPAQDTQQRLHHIWKGHVTPKITWQQSKCLLPRYLQVLFTKTLKNRYFRSISTVSLVFM